MIDSNRDWLAQELKYESRVSAWDLDEPNKVKRSHEENCPRKKVEREHIKLHEARKQDYRALKTNTKVNNMESKQAKAYATVISFVFVLLFLIIMFIGLFL